MALLKQDLISSPILIDPQFERSFRGHIDVSQYDIVGTLTQVINGKERVVTYFSRTLNPAQMNYSANDQDLLVIFGFLKHFSCYPDG